MGIKLRFRSSTIRNGCLLNLEVNKPLLYASILQWCLLNFWEILLWGGSPTQICLVFPTNMACKWGKKCCSSDILPYRWGVQKVTPQILNKHGFACSTNRSTIFYRAIQRVFTRRNILSFFLMSVYSSICENFRAIEGYVFTLGHERMRRC